MVFDVTRLTELFNVPRMVFSDVVAWKICRRDIGDGFRVDADDLGKR